MNPFLFYLSLNQGVQRHFLNSEERSIKQNPHYLLSVFVMYVIRMRSHRGQEVQEPMEGVAVTGRQQVDEELQGTLLILRVQHWRRRMWSVCDRYVIQSRSGCDHDGFCEISM